MRKLFFLSQVLIPLRNSKMSSVIPSVFDMDIGKDPDDTCVALLVALNPDKYQPALMITNDESKTKGRARFLSEVVNKAGANILVASGLPSTKNRDDTLVERAGLVPKKREDFIEDGIAYLTELIGDHDQINYFGLGALTNLATVLKSHPEFAEKINLVQMGPSLQGAYRKKAPQYNVRIDVQSFIDVLSRVKNPTLLMSHASWGAYGEKGSRQQLGIYVEDPVHQALVDSNNKGLNLFAEHLRVWNESGKPCSIMHDPLTVLSRYSNVVDYVSGELIADKEGFFDLTQATKENLKKIDSNRLVKLGDYMLTKTEIKPSFLIEVIFSLNTNYDSARIEIAKGLFGADVPKDLADKWKGYNKHRSA